jgi:hypothetical protein
MAWLKRNHGATRKYDIDPAPGRIVDQFPGMAASNRILGKQDVAWTKQIVVPVTRLEV